MRIPDHKREWFAENFGEEFVAEFDKRLDLLEQAADAARLPKKELDMPEKNEGQEAVEEEITEAATVEEGEIVKGVKQPFDLLLKEVQAMNETVTGLSQRLEALEKSEDERLAKKAADTPQAALGTMIARSVIGNPGAQLDYEKERELYRSPDETKEVDDVEPLGIGYLDEQRRQQRGKKRVIPGSMFNQQ